MKRAFGLNLPLTIDALCRGNLLIEENIQVKFIGLIFKIGHYLIA